MQCPAPGQVQSLEELKKLLFYRVTDRLSPLEKCRRGLGKFYRSTTELNIPCDHNMSLTGEESPVLFLAEGDGTYFVIYFNRAVYIFSALDYLRLSGNIANYLATPPTMEYFQTVESPVMGFYASRGPTIWGSNEKFLFVLTHKNGSATIITGTVGFISSRHVSVAQPFENSVPEQQPKIIAAAVNAENYRLAFLCEAGAAIYQLDGLINQSPLKAHFSHWIPHTGATNIFIASRLRDSIFLVESQTIVLSCNDIDPPKLPIISIEPPPSLSPIPPMFKGNAGIISHSYHSTPVLHPYIFNSHGDLRIAVLLGSCEDGYRHSQRMFQAGLLRPHGAGDMVEYASVMLDDSNYLIAVRYTNGQIWLYEFNVMYAQVTEIPHLDPELPDLQGVLVGKEEGVLKMGFAVRWVDGEIRGDGKRALVALVLELPRLVVVTRQLSVMPQRKRSVLNISEELLLEKVTQGLSYLTKPYRNYLI